MANVERIEQMEQRLNRALDAVRKMDAALEEYESALAQYEAVQEDVKCLDEYLGSENWKRDCADDQHGLLPTDLKRGVLSEDGIWNLLTDYRELGQRLEILKLNTDNSLKNIRNFAHLKK
ncbi:MAG: DUF4298 domain-containing protein [Bacteroidales bacterium]|nr:DUF4298 domain-containing protein [Bacteroidales bacterium]